jgi:hypothetical protein
MTGVTVRDLYEVGSSRAALHLLQSLFIAEVLRPSRRLWIVSPWISDIELIDNSARQFSTLCLEWPATKIRVSIVLASLTCRGSHVIVIVNEAHHNDEFVARMRSDASIPTEALTIIRSEELHEKGILGDYFTLNGSMNLTFSGVYLNEEHLIYRCDLASVEQRRLELENRWRLHL